MAEQLTVIKLGGSVITEKEKPLTPSFLTIESATREIVESQLNRLVIIHGGGSFGHPVASQYGLQDGFRERRQVLGVARTRQSMMELNKMIIDAGLRHGLSCVSVAPSSFIETENKRIARMDTAILSSLLGMGIIPILFGDVVVDREIGFCILSGDQLAARIATELDATRIVLTVDVDGVYESNPKNNPNAKLIETLSLQEAKKLVDSTREISDRPDVTGGMLAKIREMIPAVQHGATAVFINGRRAGLLLNALQGRVTLGTVMR